VLPIKGRDSEIAKLKDLIVKAGCEVVCDKAKPAEYERCLLGADVLVILICPETESDPAIDDLIAMASREGKRVVGVWIPAAKEMELPGAINSHGDAVITFDIDAIRESICGGNPRWTTPDGKPRLTPKTPRHKG
jgi:MTH538 TIR-like domain (DUF1863)